MKPEIKQDNQATRDLLGIVKVKGDSDESDSPSPLKKRRRHTLFSTTATDTLRALAPFGEDAAFHQDSQKNGYAATIINITDDDHAKDEDIEAGVEAPRAGIQENEDEYGDFDEI